MTWMILALSVFSGLLAFAQEKNETVLITVDSSQNEAEIKTICLKLQESVLLERGAFGRIDSDCRRSEDPKKQKNYLFELVWTVHAESVDLGITGENVTAPVTWTLHSSDQNENYSLARKILRRRLQFESNRDAFTASTIALALDEKSDLQFNEQTRIFQDKTSGKTLNLQESIERFKKKGDREKHYLTAALEMGAVLGLGDTLYYLNAALQDTDYTFSNALGYKFRSAGWKFDDNGWSVNHRDHPISGSLYYGFARTNNMSVMESYLYTLAGSTIWEMFGEIREKASINDQFFTSVGGMVMGETLFQIQDVFARGSNSWVNKVMSSIFGGTSAVDRLVTGKKLKRSKELSKYGLAIDVDHQFSIEAVIGQLSRGIQLNAEINSIEGAGLPGQVSGVVKNAPMTEVSLRMTTPTDRTATSFDSELQMAAVLAGYYKKNLSAQNSSLKGYEFITGIKYHYGNDDMTSSSLPDQLAYVTVLGGTMDATVYSGKFRVRAKIDVYADFATVRSLVIDEYEAAAGSREGIKSSFNKTNTYYGISPSTLGKLSLRYGPLETSYMARFHQVNSIQGWSRMQETEVTNDFKLADRRLMQEAWVSVDASKSLRLSLGAVSRQAISQIPQYNLLQNQTRRQAVGKISFLF